jgi:hypothetical protein
MKGMKINLKKAFVVSGVIMVVAVAVAVLMYALQVLEFIRILDSTQSISLVYAFIGYGFAGMGFLSGVIFIISGTLLLKRKISKK